MKTPYEDQIAREEQADHARAQARGAGLFLMVREITSTLHASGILRDVPTASALIFHVLADHLYGLQAVDVPDFTDPPTTAPGTLWPDLVAAELDKKDR